MSRCQIASASAISLLYRTMHCTTFHRHERLSSHQVIESIEALYVAIVFLNSLKFASQESRYLAALIPRGTLRYLQTVLFSHV